MFDLQIQITRPLHMHSVHKMRLIATDVARSVVCHVCVSAY